MAEEPAASAAPEGRLTGLKVPPHSIEAEQAVLGGLLLHAAAYWEIGDLLGEGDFYRTDHRLIWRTICSLMEDEGAVDVLTVGRALENLGSAARGLDMAYLAELAESTPGISNIKAYAEIVRERATLRQLISAANRIAEAAFSPQGRKSAELLDEAEREVFQIAEGRPDSVDFHRFVLFVNHEFNDWIKLFTELEIEHAYSGNGKPGAVELEQAYIHMDWSEKFSTEAGLFLMPVGMLNETHEPNTFYGVERNNVEKRIIPTTWWEAGIKGTWRLDNGVSIDAGITSGLDVDSSGVIRSGRQKVAKAINDKQAYVGRVVYSGVPGLEIGFSAFYQSDMAQKDTAADIEGLLTTGHVDYSTGGFRIRALYANWDLDGTDSAEAESQWGYYLEPSYRWELDEYFGDIGVYFRYSNYKYFSGSLKDNEIYEIGVNYWPTTNVVFKADVQEISDSDELKSKGDKVINLGVGYQF